MSTPLSLAHVHAVVLTESDAARAEEARLAALPLAERVRLGAALDGLRARPLPDGTLRLDVSLNASRFKVGDSLTLRRGAEHVELRMLAEARDHLVMGAPYGRLRSTAEGPGWVLEPTPVDLADMTLGALGRLDAPRLARMLAFADGAPRRSEPRPPRDASGLSARQSEALALALGSPDPVLVQGPPGTGKTYLLARLVRELLMDGQRVLLSAFTHHAVHNALRAVLALDPRAPACKLGHPSIAAELPDAVERLADRRALAGRLERRGAVLVGATTHAALLTLDDRRGEGTPDFDVIVLDEASQASLPTGIGALCRARRAVLFGDHRQMPPVVQGHYADGRLSRSVFEGMWRGRPGVMLDVTHRMNAALCDYPSRTWYGGELHPSPAARDRRLAFTPDGPDDPLDPDVPEAIVPRPPGEGGDQRSPTEARIIAQFVARLVQGGVAASQIAVVTPYRVQVRAIRDALARLPTAGALAAVFDAVTVDTVERIQGQERDVVFLSFVKDVDAPEDAATRVFTPERLNVALTRARVKRVLVGDPRAIHAVLQSGGTPA